MKTRRITFASSLLAASLVLSPTTPLFATTSGSGQAGGARQAQPVLVTANQTLTGTISPAVASGQAKRVKASDPTQTIRVGFQLKPRNVAQLMSAATAGEKVTTAQFKANFAPSSASVQTVRNFLTKQNLQVTAQRDDLLIVQGTVLQMENALHVKLNDYQLGNSTFYATANDPVVPSDVASELQGIVGLNQTPQTGSPVQKRLVVGTNESLTPDEVRTAYGLNAAYGNGIDGTGRNIAILQSGDFDDNDVKTFSQTFGLPYDPKKITRVQVPDTPPASYPQEEDTRAVEWAHAIAPGAAVTEYQVGMLDAGGPNVLLGLDAVLAAGSTVDVVDLSGLGGPEANMDPNTLQIWHTKLLEMVTEGITPVAATGDIGAYTYMSANASVALPASDPYVLAVGGTELNVDDSNQRTGETAWGEASQDVWTPGYTRGSGGGYSTVYSDLINGSTAKRGVPDVSMVGQNVEMYMGTEGGWVTGSGTSYAAPMWSGIIALAAQKAKHGFGWIRPLIQNIATQPATASEFHDITDGTNGLYAATSGWDPVTGWGTPANGWALVQSLASQSVAPIAKTPTIAGVVVGSQVQSDAIQNGVGTVDLIGSGFGDTNGTVSLLDQAGDVNISVPVQTWSDSDITLNTDEMFAQANHPMQPGTYTLTVTTAAQQTSNAMPVTLSDTFQVTDDSTAAQNGPTPVSGADAPVFQNVQINAITPDTSNLDAASQVVDSQYASSTAKLTIQQLAGNVQALPLVQQNGQPITPNNDGSYTVQIQNGQASVQVASVAAGTFAYHVDADDVHGVDNTAQFQALGAVQLAPLNPNASNLATVGKALQVPLALEDAYGNLVRDPDSVQVALNGPASGNVTVNGTALTANGTPKTITLTPNGLESTVLLVQDNTAKPISLTVTDTTDANVPPCAVNATFTNAAQVSISPTDDAYGIPVTTNSAQPNWLNFTVTTVDVNQLTTPFLGTATLSLRNFGVTAVDPSTLFTVQQKQSDGTWTTLSADPTSGQYPLDMSHGTLTLRVASPVAGYVSVQAKANFTGNSSVNQFTGSFVAGTVYGLQAIPLLPHMATSTTKAPQYAPVAITGFDAAQNGVSVTDKVQLTEGAGGPAVTVATLDQTGKMKVVAAAKGAWSIDLSKLVDGEIYVASTAPGVASFTLSDASNAQVQAAHFHLDFVNTTVASLQAVATSAAAGAGIEAVNVHLLDPNGNQVVNAADTVALTIKAYKGQVTVTDAQGNALQANGQGQYVVPSSAGNAVFHLQDTLVETLNYSFSDVTEPSVKAATATGNFVNPSKFVMTPISKTVLGSNQPVTVQVTAADSKGLPLGHATVYLAFVQTAGGGQAVVNGDTPIALTTTAQPFVTDDQGNVTITYTTPHVLPNGGTDSIVAQDNQDPKKAKVKSTDSYAFVAAASYLWSGDGKTIAKSGTLSAGQPTTVTVKALDAKKNALPNTIVYLSLSATNVGGTATVVGAETGLSSTPTAYVTDANGQVTVTYTTPQYLPGNETDVINVQDSNSKTPHVKAADSYTYKAVGKLSFTPTTLGKSGSLQPGATVNLMLNVQDATKNAMPNTIIYLSLKSLGGSTASVDPLNAIDGQTDLSGQLLPFVTDANGNIQIAYTVPNSLPNGGTDTLAIQDALTGAKQKASLTYTFLKSTH